MSLFITALVGRGGGKTTGDKARKVKRMLLTPRAKCVYVATTRPQAEILMWGPLKDTFESLGFRLGEDVIFNETKLWCTLVCNGSVLRLVGADDKRETDKLRGQPFHEVTIDEAASFPPKLLEDLLDRVIGPRLGDYNGTLCMIGTPGHVLSGPFYDYTRPGARSEAGKPLHCPYADRHLPEYAGWTGYSSHAWNLRDDIMVIPDAAERYPSLVGVYKRALLNKENKGWGDDHPVWMREYLGKWAADDTTSMFRYRAHLTGEAATERSVPDGTAWNQWDPPRVGPMQIAELPKGADGKERTDWHYAYGFDMGHSDPFAVTVFAFSPSDTTRTLYHVYSFEKTKMYARPIAQLLLGTDDTRPTGCCSHEKPLGLFGSTGWPVGMVADMTHLGGNVLEELSQVYGIRIEPAEQKGKFAAVELFNGDLVDGRIKILKGSTLEKQLLELQWQPDEFGRLKEPRGAANHSVDSAIYSRRLIAHLFDTGSVAPTPTRSDDSPVSSGRSLYDPFGEADETSLAEPDWGDLYRV